MPPSLYPEVYPGLYASLYTRRCTLGYMPPCISEVYTGLYASLLASQVGYWAICLPTSLPGGYTSLYASLSTRFTVGLHPWAHRPLCALMPLRIVTLLLF